MNYSEDLPVRAPPGLGDHGEPALGPLLEHAADQPLTAAVVVHVGGLDQGDPGINGGVQRGHRVVLTDFAPVRAELPCAEADH